MTDVVSGDSVIRASIDSLSDYLTTNLASLLSNQNLGALVEEYYTNAGSNATTEGLVNFLATAITGSLASTEIANLIRAYKGNITPPAISLSNLTVDFEATKVELTNLFQEYPAWTDDTTSAVGQSFINAIATAITYQTYNIIKAAQESMIPTATLESSIYAGTKNLGVRINRLTSGTCTVSLTYSGTSLPLVIPAYTQFYVGNYSLYNRSALLINSTEAITATLYEGIINTVDFTATGEAYQSYIFGDSDNTISDIDVLVYVGGKLWTRTEYTSYYSTGLWNYTASDQVYVDGTTPDGNVQISFGNGVFGMSPGAGQTISIIYVNTMGSGGNVDLTNSAITCNSINGISGVVTSKITGGADARSVSDYKALSPGMFAAKNGAVTNDQINALVGTYPGVVDGYVMFQQEYAPSDITKSMQAIAVLLTSTMWSTDNYQTFISWLKKIGIANMQYTIQQPTTVTMNITATIGCYSQANLETVENTAIANITNAFQLKQGILGYSRYLSDLDKVIRSASNMIDYIQFDPSTTDEILTSNSVYVVLGSVNITAVYSQRNVLNA